jgi:hypothetical protein
VRSSNYVDFSVRQNKAIERAIVFDGIRRLLPVLPAEEFVFVGLGSVWFVDFDIAHRELGVEKMVSIEGDDVLFARAKFNKPYRTIEVFEGLSHDVIPVLIDTRPDLYAHPWIVWLDYDEPIDETKLDELTTLVERLPEDSILLTTFVADVQKYEPRPVDRAARFVELFGDAFPIERFETRDDWRDERKVMSAIADAVIGTLVSHAVDVAREGGMVAAFNLTYQDGAPMGTVGGVLPTPDAEDAVKAKLAAAPWPAMFRDPIVTPPLTTKEVAALRALLPSESVPTRADLQALGFDLLEDQIKSFADHYMTYPSFVQTAR